MDLKAFMWCFRHDFSPAIKMERLVPRRDRHVELIKVSHSGNRRVLHERQVCYEHKLVQVNSRGGKIPDMT